ncbi:MAG: V4R domain-containing protein [Candidatus Thorarchaeota archaeon]
MKSVYLFHRDGNPLLQVPLDEADKIKPQSIKGLFERLFSAIDEIFTELGHPEIRSVAVNEGLLVYKVQDPFLFAVYTNKPKSEEFAKQLVEQIEYEFERVYNDLPRIGDSSVYEGHFNPFESKIREIYETLVNLRKEYPKLLAYLPSFVPLFRLNEVLNLGLDIIAGYPHDTIKLVRQLNLFFSDDQGLEDVIARTIGRYSGHQIAKNHFEPSMVINQENVLDLLNEISVTKLDETNEVFDVVLCPVCREKTSEKPMCHFFSGFIEGALDNPSISVEEISCKATGERSCKFRLLIS